MGDGLPMPKMIGQKERLEMSKEVVTPGADPTDVTTSSDPSAAATSAPSAAAVRKPVEVTDDIGDQAPAKPKVEKSPEELAKQARVATLNATAASHREARAAFKAWYNQSWVAAQKGELSVEALKLVIEEVQGLCATTWAQFNEEAKTNAPATPTA